MISLLSGDYNGSAFEYFGAAHLGAVAFLVLLNLYLLRFRDASDRTKGTIRHILALVLLVNEIAWHYWTFTVGQWTIQTMLPLHLCSLLVWTGVLMLMTKNYRIYEFMYFMGIGGAIQALATPGLGRYGFPHYAFFQYFLSHGLIITSAIYMTVVEGFRPTWKSMLRVFIWMNVYVAIVFVINNAIGSNYLMIDHKPPTPSLLDLLPPWPIYILYMEMIGVATMLLLYIPFAARDWMERYHLKKDNVEGLKSISK